MIKKNNKISEFLYYSFTYPKTTYSKINFQRQNSFYKGHYTQLNYYYNHHDSRMGVMGDGEMGLYASLQFKRDRQQRNEKD